MFKRILVPIDGSKRAEHAGFAAIDLARQLHASIVLLHAYPTFQIVITEPVFVSPELISEEAYNRSQVRTAMKYLAVIERYAEEAGVPCQSRIVVNDAPAKAIVSAADDPEDSCDAIFMAAHGRSELVQALLGSVTTRVLSLCSTPVVVYREPKETRKAETEMRQSA